jgi:hypothetical protein
MRYYSYNEMGDDGENIVVTKSEDDIQVKKHFGVTE